MLAIGGRVSILLGVPLGQPITIRRITVLSEATALGHLIGSKFTVVRILS
jgi:hypothetical protein